MAHDDVDEHSGGASRGSVGDVFRLIRAGIATSRPALGRETRLAPSTVSLRVEALERLGLIDEAGNEGSRGGRRARRLRIAPTAGHVAVVILGVQHLTVALTDLTGDILACTRVITPTNSDPEALVTDIWRDVQALQAAHRVEPTRLRGIAVGIPAPIDRRGERAVFPAFMPNWHGVDIAGLFAHRADVPVLIENDANLLAQAEVPGLLNAPDGGHLLAIKLGNRIGCGIVSAGRLHRGLSGAAGEISHTSVEGDAVISCACGTPNCLESVAGGGALVMRLRALGHEISTVEELVELGRGSDAAVIGELRTAGERIGAVLAPIVNFFNPGEVVLGGTLSGSAPLVAAIRAEIFRRCLPQMTESLDVRAARDPQTAEVRGASQLILDRVLDPARIDQLADALRDD